MDELLPHLIKKDTELRSAKRESLRLRSSIIDKDTSDQELIRELAQDLGRLSGEDLEQVYNEVVAFLQDTKFANDCHEPRTGRFCEVPGGARYPNPLKGMKKGEASRLVLGTLRNVWKEKVSNLVKFNVAAAVVSAGVLLTNPGIHAQLMFGSEESLMYLGAGLMALMWSQGKTGK